MKISKVIATAPVLLAVLLAGGCSGKKQDAGMDVPVLVAKSVVTNLPVQIDPPPVGHVTPYSSVSIRPQIGGIISRVHFEEGQEVHKGELLFTIDPRPAQAALDAARAALARDMAQMQNAKIQFEREQQLFEQKLVSQNDYDTSKAGLDALAGTVEGDQSTVTNAQLNLEFTEIRAPFDGRTGSLRFHEGNVVKAPDDTLLMINQVKPIYVVFAVPEQYLPEIRRQMKTARLKVQVSFQNLQGPPPQGELTFIDNTVDTTTGTIILKATFPNEDDALWPGQFVQVELTLSELTNVVAVPSQAVQTGQNGQYVFTVKPDLTVEQRPVTIGIAYGGETVVSQGLSPGETVVTDGQLRLAPGVTVNIKSSLPPPAAAAPSNAP